MRKKGFGFNFASQNKTQAMNALAQRLARQWYAAQCEDRSRFYLEELCEWYVGPSLKRPDPALSAKRVALPLFPGVYTREDVVRVFVLENAMVAVFLVVLIGRCCNPRPT